ncbi:DUF1851 domain-containing protein, partial [Acinetobacter baumannii]|nr:DUF1851 domain-containing protein [Acinetobacter baumannii]
MPDPQNQQFWSKIAERPTEIQQQFWYGAEKLAKYLNDEFYGSDFFFLPKKNYLDYTDKNGNKLFDRAVKKLGVLKADEMYAFEPALALGGEESLQHLTKVNLP